MEEEKSYLANTIELLQHLIETETDNLTGRKRELISSRKDMWDNSAHFADDFDKLIEMNQHLQSVQSRTSDYESTRKSIERYKKMLDTPYFGRLDFIETGEEENEKIYIGKGHVHDGESGKIIVYDWRAPISSMYYRFEPGKASFKAPFGEIVGELTLKRQYKIVKAQLKYFFDCSVQISDEILQEVLSRNSSPKMRNIIETIQKEQDIIIRDTENDLLIVQGVAGSGKTSIALHRVAFLLYEGMSSRLASNNILILAPNDAFNNYIGQVLPELGEENVVRATMEGMVKTILEDEVEKNSFIGFEGRSKQLEECILGRGSIGGDAVVNWVKFKGSSTFREIIDRYLKLYEHRLLKFDDVYYNGRLILNKIEFKSMFLNNKIGAVMAKRLARIESRIMDMTVDLRKERLKKIETIVGRSDEHQFEIKSFSRLLLMKNSQAFSAKLKKVTQLDIFSIYKSLFKSKEQFYKIAKGLTLPEDIDEIIEYTYATMDGQSPNYEDLTAIAYMKLKVFGKDANEDIRQVVIDEVQDYYPIQLAIMKELYERAKFTVVGDIAQSIERSCEVSRYDDLPELLGKSKTIRLSLNRSYRSSYEINEFAKDIHEGIVDCISFPRYEEVPEVIFQENEETLLKMLLERNLRYLGEGFKTVAILCKTMKQTEALYNKLKDKMEIRIVEGNDDETEKGCMIMPIYAAKGLEFDAVLLYGVDDVNYCTNMDRRLLYIACTRALHRLSIYYIGKKSRFLKESS